MKRFESLEQEEKTIRHDKDTLDTKETKKHVLPIVIVTIIAVTIVSVLCIKLFVPKKNTTNAKTATKAYEVEVDGKKYSADTIEELNEMVGFDISYAFNNDTNKDSTGSEESDESSAKEYSFYEDGEMAEIKNANGKFKFGVEEATILKETGFRDAVYQLTWVTENEDYTGTGGTGTTVSDLKVVDSDGYIVEQMSSGWEGEWINDYEQPKAGEKCKSKHTFIINNPDCTYLDVSLDKYAVTCRVNIDNLENGVSSIPEDATEEEVKVTKLAQSYVESIPYSYNGLVKQLEYEKYSHEEAVYGADNCGADWNEQAVLCAKQYLEITNYSREEMIKQLEFEEFTHEQAVYGTDNCGKEW